MIWRTDCCPRMLGAASDQLQRELRYCRNFPGGAWRSVGWGGGVIELFSEATVTDLRHSYVVSAARLPAAKCQARCEIPCKETVQISRPLQLHLPILLLRRTMCQYFARTAPTATTASLCPSARRTSVTSVPIYSTGSCWKDLSIFQRAFIGSWWLMISLQ